MLLYRGQEAWVDLRSVVAWRSVLSGGIFVLYRGKRPLNTWLSLPLSTPFSATVPGSSLGLSPALYTPNLNCSGRSAVLRPSEIHPRFF